jgi:hypothetical protein
VIGAVSGATGAEVGGTSAGCLFIAAPFFNNVEPPSSIRQAKVIMQNWIPAIIIGIRGLHGVRRRSTSFKRTLFRSPEAHTWHFLFHFLFSLPHFDNKLLISAPATYFSTIWPVQGVQGGQDSKCFGPCCSPHGLWSVP